LANLFKSILYKLKPVFVLVVVMLLFFGCSTKKDTWVRRTFHGITAHYNAYYNGQVALEESRVTISKDHKDNFSEILDIFPLGTIESVKSVSQKLERSMEKASIVIHKHSMVFNNEEKIVWIPRSYFMIAQARFYGHEYGLAKQTFKYIIGKYPKQEVRYDAQLWIARVQIIEGDYDEARGSLGSIENNIKSGNASEDLKRLYPMVYADLYLKQNNYSASIPYLKQAIELNPKKEIKARLYFIMGQVYQKQNQYKDAIKAYREVLKNNPVYDLDFNARINMSQCFEGSGSSYKSIMSQLVKMLKDEKNKEYLDQIYYAMANVELKRKNEPTAIDYLKLSVEKSKNNNLQKSFSALKLADIYFEKGDYTHAQAYYDSTILFLPTTYPDYEELKNRKEILTELVKNILVVQHEDSLQNLADMSEALRNKKIDKIIQEEIDKELKAQEEERQRQESLQFMEENRRSTQSVTQAQNQKFYFYNPQTLSFGFTEFQKKWGQRKLEDFWRISSKQTMDFGTEDGAEEEALATNDSLKKMQKDRKSRAFYLKDIPLTTAQKDTSNRKIADALYNMGFIYKEQLVNTKKSTESFEKLLKRFPTTVHTAAAYYFLHQMYLKANDDGEANFYKKALIKEYPESDYAKLIQDPEFYKKLQEDTQKAKDLYDKAYRMYNLSRYDKAIQYAAEAITTYPFEKETLAQCALIKALSIGKTSDTASFLSALTIVVENYQQTESAELAATIISRLKEGQRITKESSSTQAAKEIRENQQPSIYSDVKSGTHMFIVIVNRKASKSTELQQQLTIHNEKYFATNRLTVSAIPLDNDNIIVGVSNFKNSDEALIYLNTLKRNSEMSAQMKKLESFYYLISQENYTRLYKTRNLEAYSSFYSKIYPEVK
jgi:tetratricopeptide (TPR) repeat protein